MEDGNIITGGGVTAGIDFAFRIAEILHGRDFAEMLQLVLEYDPAPLAQGTPDRARLEIVAMARDAMNSRGLSMAKTSARTVARRMSSRRPEDERSA